MELAKVYFRLCSHLASQGISVVISAIAMYDDVFKWVAANIPRSLQVYLRVPEDERIRRDLGSKNVYRNLTTAMLGYDEPVGANLVIDNYGGFESDAAARLIVEKYVATLALGESKLADHGKYKHWDEFYAREGGVPEPSSFAVAVAAQLKQSVRLLEVGCGNGRDAAFFARSGHHVLALDTSQGAIELCRRSFGQLSIHFDQGTAEHLESSPNHPRFDVVYSRFVLHAMTVQEEASFCRAARELLVPEGRLFIECRSINDPMSREGEVIGPTERIFGHYRRFIIMEELLRRLESVGFRVVASAEGKGLAVLKDEDPVVIRIEATR